MHCARQLLLLVSLARAAQASALGVLAAHHARFWELDSLEDYAWLPKTTNLAGLSAAVGAQAYLKKLWWERGARAKLRRYEDLDRMERLQKVGDGLVGCYAALVHRAATPPCTLAHGDFRLDNMFYFVQSGEIIDWRAIDWQFTGMQRAIVDVSYFLGLCLTLPAQTHPRLREGGANENELELAACHNRLLSGYAQALSFNGITVEGAKDSAGKDSNMVQYKADFVMGLLLAWATFLFGDAAETTATRASVGMCTQEELEEQVARVQGDESMESRMRQVHRVGLSRIGSAILAHENAVLALLRELSTNEALEQVHGEKPTSENEEEGGAKM